MSGGVDLNNPKALSFSQVIRQLYKNLLAFWLFWATASAKVKK
jgi:hypothetical protein